MLNPVLPVSGLPLLLPLDKLQPSDIINCIPEKRLVLDAAAVAAVVAVAVVEPHALTPG